MNLNKIKDILPSMVELDLPAMRGKKLHLIISAGFEDRALGLLELISNSGIGHSVKTVSILNYLPDDQKNDRNSNRIHELLNNLGIARKSIQELFFDRENPLELSDSLQELIIPADVNPHILLDISAMSKLPILYFLHVLWNRNSSFSVVYTEAQKFGPSKEECELAFEKGLPGQNMLPELLFSGIFEPVVPNEFAGNCPLTTNRALVAFLGYNKRQIMGVASMIPYQFFVPIIGQTSYTGPAWEWRAKALVEINNSDLLTSGKLISDLPITDFYKELPPIDKEYRMNVSNFDYREAVLALLAICEAHKYRHSLSVAPLGTKMQTVGLFLFAMLFPEVQIVYAPPKDFNPKYSEGIKTIWRIPFPHPKELESRLRAQTNPHLAAWEKEFALKLR